MSNKQPKQGCNCPACRQLRAEQGTVSDNEAPLSDIVWIDSDLPRARLYEEMSNRFQALVNDKNLVPYSQAPKEDKSTQAEREARTAIEKYLLKEEHTVQWSDVKGNEQAKLEMIEAIEHPYTKAELYKFYGLRPPKGILLFGPPGCGKTMLAKAAASRLRTLHKDKKCEAPNLLVVNGPEIQTAWVGQTEKIIREIFAYARTFHKRYGFPLTIFMDEADALLPNRDSKGGRPVYGYEESQVATFLAEMDGLKESSALVILATNRPQSIDSALLRNGRCDKKIQVRRPDRQTIEAILLSTLTGIPSRHEPQVLVKHTLGELYSDHYILVDLTGVNAETKEEIHLVLNLSDIVNGALITAIASEAKSAAFRRDLAAGTMTGLDLPDLDSALGALCTQNKGLPHWDALFEKATAMALDHEMVQKATVKETKGRFN